MNPASTNLGFKNYAFISYSRRDEGAANWLHKALESFRIPTGLPALPDGEKWPKHVRPLFRDKTDLEFRAQSFVRQIEEELPASRFLIVLCSPNAAQSHPDGQHYVDWEIRQFIQAHGVDYARSHILPVILAGDPGHNDPARECLPPALLEFGPAFREHNFPLLKDLPTDKRGEAEAREDCVIGCVSFLLGVDRRVIRDRYLIAQRERMRLYVSLASVVGLLLAGLAIWASIERKRAKDSEKAVVETLARADFDEASRRLDDRHDTSRALAYLGSSLSRQSFPPAESRLQELILHRSWLVEREKTAFEVGKNESAMLSPDLGRVVRVRFDASGIPGRVTVHALGVAGNSPAVELSEPAAQAVFPNTAECVVTQTRAEDGKTRCRFWRPSDGAPVGTVLLEPAQAPVAVSAKGAYVLVGDDRTKTLTLVRTVDGRRMAELPEEEGWRWRGDFAEPALLVFAPDESAVFVVDRQGDTETFARGKRAAKPRVRIRGYATADGHELWRREDAGDVRQLVVAPDAAFAIYSYSANGAEDWQLVLQPLATNIKSWTQRVARMPGRLLLSPDGCSLAVIDGKQIVIRDPYVGGAVRFEPRIFPTSVRDGVFSHDGRRVAYFTESPEIGAIDVETGEAVVEPHLLGERAVVLAFSRDDGSLHVQADSGIRRFDLQVSPLAPRLIQPASQLVLQQVAADPAGHGLALVSSDVEKRGAVELRTIDGAACAPATFLDEAANAVAFSPDGKFFLVGTGALHGQGGALWIYAVTEGAWHPKQKQKEGKPTEATTLAGQRIDVPDGMVRGVRFSADGKLAVLDLWRGEEKAGGIALVDVAARALVPNFIEQAAGVAAMALSADGHRLVVAGGDRVIRIWDLERRRQVGAEAQMSVSVESVDVSADGTQIAVGSRFGDGVGQLLMFSGEGKALWEKPRSFMSGVQRVRLARDGNSVAVAFRDNSVVVLDVATGRPRTDAINPLQRQLWTLCVSADQPLIASAFPVTDMQFLSAEGDREVLAVASGSWETHRGVVELWDPGTGRRLGDRLLHGNYARGLTALPEGRFASWSTAGCLVAAVPWALGEKEWKPGLFPAITTAVGGWRMNEWRAPEAVDGDLAQALAASHEIPNWEKLLKWWATPTTQRTLEPGATAMLKERLDQLVKDGYLAEYRQVLDLQPDHPAAMAEYWFTVARETAEAAFMASVKELPREERLQRQMEWAKFSGDALREKIFADPKAKRLAEFWTAELCAKHPELARAWQERATFLRLVGREAEAATVLERALALGGGDFAIREQVALLKAQQGDFAGAEGAFDALCEWLEKNPRTDDDALRTIAKAGQSRLYFDTVGRGLGGVERDVRWIVDNLARALGPISRLTREQGNQLIDASEKLTDFLARIDTGPALTIEAHARLLQALQGKAGTTNFETVQATLLGHKAFAEILQGEAVAARRDLDQARRFSPELKMGLDAWRAHTFAIEGRADEAQALYAQVLELDGDYAGALSKGIALDLQRLRRRGIAVRGLEDFQRRLAQQLTGRPDTELVVTVLRPGDQAEKVGIKVGDRLLTYAGEPVLDLEWFIWERQLESQQGLREPRTIVVRRDGRQLTFEVQPGRLGMGLKEP